MKLKSSMVAIIAISSMSFAGGMIMEPAYENEVVDIPVEPVVEEYQPPVEVKKEPKKVEVKKEPIKVEVKKEPEEVKPKSVSKRSGLYVAGGLTDVAVRNSGKVNLLSSKKGQDRQIGFTGRLGYNFMDYIGAELRGTYGISKNKGDKFKQIGAYLKPNYDVTNEINIYGLLGASKTNVGVGSQTGLSIGAGLDYGINDKISVFTDLVNYMKKSDTAAQWGLTVGATYKF